MATIITTRDAADLAATEVLAQVQAAEDAVRTALAALEALETARPELDGQVYYTRKALRTAVHELAIAWDEAPRDGVHKR